MKHYSIILGIMCSASTAAAQTFVCGPDTAGSNCRLEILSPKTGACPGGTPNCAAVISSLTVNRTACASAPLVDVNVNVDLVHTQIGDIVMKLVAPDSTEVTLVSRPGKTTAAPLGCVQQDIKARFTAQGVGVGCSAHLPSVGGSVTPLDDITVLNGKQANGVWRLVVRDDESSGAGYLAGWSLEMPCELSAVTFAASDAEADFTGNNPGEITVTRTAGLANDIDVNLTFEGIGGSLISIPSSVHFAPNETTTTFAVKPINFDDATTMRAVVVKAAPGEYTADAGATINVAPVGPPKPVPITVPTTPPSTAKSGCGCRGTPDTTSIVALLLAFALRRRRSAAR